MLACRKTRWAVYAAVTFDEQELIEKAVNIYNTLISNISAVEQINASYIHSDTKVQLAYYEKISSNIANGLVNAGQSKAQCIELEPQLQ